MNNTFLCISSYYKGADFIKQCKALGNHVILITSDSLRSANWPWESIDESYFMEEIKPFKWNMDHLILGVAHLLKSRNVDRIVALDDFDVEKGAQLRETFRIPGMGQTTHRYFRDKLAMRQQALDKKLSAPKFTSIFNNEDVNQFADNVPAPWVLKPRSEASATGIKKIHSKDELWQVIHGLGEERYKFLLEQFRPGDVYHVDSLVNEGKVIFTSSSKYLAPPMAVSHEGGVFRTMILDSKSDDAKKLKELNEHLLTDFGIVYGATHSEFIKCHEDGEWYFLETSARVGGAFIPEMVEAATNINLWREWANIENALIHKKKYKLPKTKNEYAGLLITLSHEHTPDLSFVTEKEFIQQMYKDHHVIMLFQSKKQKNVIDCLDKYLEIITDKYSSFIPPSDTPTS